MDTVFRNERQKTSNSTDTKPLSPEDSARKIAELERALTIVKGLVDSMQTERQNTNKKIKSLLDKLDRQKAVMKENKRLQTTLDKLRENERDPDYKDALAHALHENEVLIRKIDEIREDADTTDAKYRVVVEEKKAMFEKLKLLKAAAVDLKVSAAGDKAEIPN